jgi:uncharacterized protein DUF5320
MPGRDGTGPVGEGSKTGKAIGTCDENKVTRDIRKAGCGLGLGYRRGFGRGQGKSCGRNKWDYVNKKDLLMEEKAILENRLNLINKELDMMEKNMASEA